MARPLISSFTLLPSQALAASQPIHEGSAASNFGELDLSENINRLWATTVPQYAWTDFNSDAGYIDESTAGAYTVRAGWKRRIVEDLTEVTCSAYVYNTDAVNAGKIKFTIQSNAATTGDIAVAADGAGLNWTLVSGTLVIDTATVRNMIRLEMEAPAAGSVRVRGVSIRPRARSSVPAGVTTDGFVAHDTLEVDANSPLSTFHRQAQFANMGMIYKTRMDTIVAWSEDGEVRTPLTYAAYRTASTTYVVVARIPLTAIKGQDAIEWEVNGYHIGASGTVRLRTDYMDKAGIAAVEVALGNTWASPYNHWQGDGGSTLTSLPGLKGDFLEVAIKAGAASSAYLMGLSAWFKDID